MPLNGNHGQQTIIIIVCSRSQSSASWRWLLPGGERETPYLMMRFIVVVCWQHTHSHTYDFNFNKLILSFCPIADSFVVAWKRGIAILSAGSVKVTPDPRVRLVNGYSLQIKEAVPQDAGDYVCQIATMEPREITHTVEILGKWFCSICPSMYHRIAISLVSSWHDLHVYIAGVSRIFFHSLLCSSKYWVELSWNVKCVVCRHKLAYVGNLSVSEWMGMCVSCGGCLGLLIVQCTHKAVRWFGDWQMEMSVFVFDNGYDDVDGNDFTVLHKSTCIIFICSCIKHICHRTMTRIFKNVFRLKFA